MKGRIASGLLGALGIALFLATWEIVGRTGLLGISWPPLSDVLEMLADENRFPLFQPAGGNESLMPTAFTPGNRRRADSPRR